jgi:hypothetical protein
MAINTSFVVPVLGERFVGWVMPGVEPGGGETQRMGAVGIRYQLIQKLFSILISPILT